MTDNVIRPAQFQKRRQPRRKRRERDPVDTAADAFIDACHELKYHQCCLALSRAMAYVCGRSSSEGLDGGGGD